MYKPKCVLKNETHKIPWDFKIQTELLYIDQHILNESKTRQENQAMAWIDYKKAYDMVPQTWILHCLKMYKISHEVINFIEQTM